MEKREDWMLRLKSVLLHGRILNNRISPNDSDEVLHPGSSATTTVARDPNPAARPLPSIQENQAAQSDVLHPAGNTPRTPVRPIQVDTNEQVLRPGASTINQSVTSANEEMLHPGGTVNQTTASDTLRPGATVIEQPAATAVTNETLRPGATTIKDQAEQQAAAQPLPAAEAPKTKEFNFNQEFFVKSAGKIIDITAENVKKWLHLDFNQLPEEPAWDEVIVSEYMGRKVVFVHSARKVFDDGRSPLDLPGNLFRDGAELGQNTLGWGPYQVKQHLQQAVSENRTATFFGADGSEQTYRLTSAQYRPYQEVVDTDIWGKALNNNVHGFDKYIANTNPDDVIVIFCGRSNVEAVRQGIDVMNQFKAELSPEQAAAVTVLENGKAPLDTYHKAVAEMFRFLHAHDKEHNTSYYEKLMLLYTGAPYNKDPNALREANPYMFSGARYVLGLSPVK